MIHDCDSSAAVMRPCNKCGKVLEVNSDNFHQLRVKRSFPLQDWIGFYYDCKQCRNDKKRIWNKNNKKKISDYNKKYKKMLD
jgi:5-methylcytosine-specific restriction endonuclease McrA